MLEPAGHRLLVEIQPESDETETVSEMGIITEVGKTKLQRTLEKNKQQHGTLIAIGINAWKAFDTEQPWANVGDEIIFAAFSGQDAVDPHMHVDDEGRCFIIISDEDLICVTKEGEPQGFRDFRKEFEKKEVV